MKRLMRNGFMLIVHTVLLLILCSCGTAKPTSVTSHSSQFAHADYRTVNYYVSNKDILNPGRGFYYPFQTTTEDFQGLDVDELKRLRNTYTRSSGRNYKVKHNLILRQYILNTYVDQEVLSDEFLQSMQADFDAVRQAGVQVIVRFSYNNVPPTGDCGSWICPPYGDAKKEIVLSHIAQVGKVLSQNEDVVLTWQAGFIGTWGEMMFTDHFGDFDTQGTIYDENWQDRIDIVTALLNAVPKDTTVQVRKPQLIQKFMYGINAPLNSPGLNEKEAYNGSFASRLGLYNDCFLATKDDWGTYADYGTSAQPPKNNDLVVEQLKAQQRQHSQYTLVGGETCDDGYEPQNNCSGGVVDIIDEFNFSYLNSAYNNDVNNDWQDEGCMDEIIKRLGYRVHLQEGQFASYAETQGKMRVYLKFINTGFTSPTFPMGLSLTFTNIDTAQKVSVMLNNKKYDIRHWQPNEEIEVLESIALPNDMVAGRYRLSLHIANLRNNKSVAKRPEYSIQLANKDMWNAEYGINDLHHTIVIGKQK